MPRVVQTPVYGSAQRAEQARTLSEAGVTVVVRDHAVAGRGSREVPCLSLQSRAPCPWWERPDVYWLTRLFSAQRSWASAMDMGGPARFSEVMGSVVLPGGAGDVYRRRYPDDPDESAAAARTLAGDPWMRVVAVVRGAGRALNGQIAALADIAPGAQDRSLLKILAPLSKAEVLETAWHHAPGLAYPRARVWQINDSGPYTAWARQITESGLAVSAFGPMPMSLHGGDSRADPARNRNTRHQTLAVEAALRAMEVGGSWVAWMPEAACRPKWFLPDGHPGHDRDLGIVADGCLIRRDGARVFLEIEASQSSRNAARFAQRVSKWSALFNDGPFGAALLFIAAGGPDTIAPVASEIRRAVEENSTARSRPYLLVGSWIDYSPDFGLVSTDCARLRAGRFNGRGWEECNASQIEVLGAEAGILARVKPLAFTPDWAYRPIPEPGP